jgi:hypothetical protein
MMAESRAGRLQYAVEMIMFRHAIDRMAGGSVRQHGPPLSF